MINYATLGSLITPAKVIRCGNDSFPVLSMTMHNGIVMQSERFKKKLASADQSDYKVVKRGQLVVGFPIDEGVLYVQKAADEGIMSPAYNVWDIDSKVIDPDFLELCLHSPQSMQYYKNKLRGTTARRRSIPVSDLEALKIRLPDMQTQHEIVAIIKKAEAIIVDRQEQLDYFEQLVKSRFIELFGDPKYNKSNLVKIGEIGSLTSGGTPSRAKPEYFEGDIRWYSAGELNSLYLPDSVEHISKTALQESSAKLFNKGTLMIGMYDTAAFKLGILTENSSSNQACANLNPQNDYNVVWLYYLFDIMKPIFLQKRQGVRQKNLSLSKIKEFEVPNAPIGIQNHFAAFVTQVDKSKYCSQKFEELCRELIKIYEQEWM